MNLIQSHKCSFPIIESHIFKQFKLNSSMRATWSDIQFEVHPKLYTPSTLNIDFIQWHTQLNVCAVK